MKTILEILRHRLFEVYLLFISKDFLLTLVTVDCQIRQKTSNLRIPSIPHKSLERLCKYVTNFSMYLRDTIANPPKQQKRAQYSIYSIRIL